MEITKTCVIIVCLPIESTPQAVMTNGIIAPPWSPADLPTLRAAYSDRTAALMAYFANFAYRTVIEARGVIGVPPELAGLGFNRLTSFHNDLTDGWAYIAESAVLIVLAFRGTQSSLNWHTNFETRLINPGTDPRLRVHQGFYSAFERLSDGAKGIREKMTELQATSDNYIPIYITGHSLWGRVGTDCCRGTWQRSNCGVLHIWVAKSW
jgi:hypothetical protein